MLTLGKTAQTLSLLLAERADGRTPLPTLLICPMSLVSNWQKEAARFAPGLRVYVHHGGTRRRDDEFSYVAAWEWTGEGKEPVMHREDLKFENVAPSQRSYK